MPRVHLKSHEDLEHLGQKPNPEPREESGHPNGEHQDDAEPDVAAPERGCRHAGQHQDAKDECRSSHDPRKDVRYACVKLDRRVLPLTAAFP